MTISVPSNHGKPNVETACRVGRQSEQVVGPVRVSERENDRLELELLDRLDERPRQRRSITQWRREVVLGVDVLFVLRRSRATGQWQLPVRRASMP